MTPYILLCWARVRQYCKDGETQFVVEGAYIPNRHNIEHKLFTRYEATIPAHNVTNKLAQQLVFHEDDKDLNFSKDGIMYDVYVREKEHWI
jgi:hypothetical protein